MLTAQGIRAGNRRAGAFACDHFARVMDALQLRLERPPSRRPLQRRERCPFPPILSPRPTHL